MNNKSKFSDDWIIEFMTASAYALFVLFTIWAVKSINNTGVAASFIVMITIALAEANLIRKYLYAARELKRQNDELRRDNEQPRMD